MKTFIYGLATGLYLAIALLLLTMLATALLMGCSHAPATACFGDESPGEPCPPAHFPEESWDQGHLKQHDNTCATMVFIAPGGDLEQCP
jgi:hypothetical protein